MAKQKRSIEERLYEKIMPEPNSGCWLWLGCLSGGYGRIGVGSRSDGTRTVKLASRVMYEIERGLIPDGLELMHSCDNKLCVNPDHLYPGTHAQNMFDAGVRGLLNPPDCTGRARDEFGRFA